jgi:hemerythrin
LIAAREALLIVSLMCPLQWRGDFDTGIRKMDVEHRELIGHIMQLQQQLGANPEPGKVLPVLERIYALIAEHFALEERLMQQIHFQAYADHKQDHETLLDELREIMDEVEQDGVFDDTQLTDDLDRWFSDHFRLYDVRLYEKGSTGES